MSAYFTLGILTGLVSEESARQWALEVIAEQVEPPFEVIEVALAKNRRILLERLAEIRGQGDSSQAGRFLLNAIESKFKNEQSYGLRAALGQAMSITKATELPESVYHALDGVDDYLFQVEDCCYGTEQKAILQFLEILNAEGRNIPSYFNFSPFYPSFNFVSVQPIDS